jgi:general stress protein YciG
MAKNAAAVALGRRGGKATAKKLTPEQRSESARKAAQARWKREKKAKQFASKS